MQANELRIGNLVYYHVEDNIEGDYDVVNTIDYEDIRIIFGIGDDYYKPIPLTEEWLKKLGFKYQERDVSHGNGKIERFWIMKWSSDGDEYWLEINLHPITKDTNGFFWLNWNIGGGNHFVHLPHSCKLHYVHQLQNLYFALTGEELTVKDI